MANPPKMDSLPSPSINVVLRFTIKLVSSEASPDMNEKSTPSAIGVICKSTACSPVEFVYTAFVATPSTKNVCIAAVELLSPKFSGAFMLT